MIWPYKKIIAIMLIFLMIFPLFPKISSATKFDFDPEHETIQKLVNDGYEMYNQNLKPLNRHVYEDKKYKIVVWGDWSDTDSYELKEGERRYLGQDYDGDSVANDLFPNDDTSKIPFENKNWLIRNETKEGWGDLSSIQKEQILYQNPIWNDGEGEIKYSISSILRNVNGDKEKYIIIQSAPTESVKGSVRLYHKTRNGKVWYDTFTIPMLPSDKITIEYINVATGNDIISPMEENMENGSNPYIIPDFTSRNFEFSHIKMDNGDVFNKSSNYMEGTTIHVSSNSNGDKHEVKMYYNPIGPIIADLEITADPNYIEEGKTKDVKVTLNAGNSHSEYGIDEYYFEASLSESFYNSKTITVQNSKTTFTFENIEPNTTIYGRVTVKDYDTGKTATITNHVMIGKTSKPPIDHEELSIYSLFNVNPVIWKYKHDVTFETNDFNYQDKSKFNRDSQDWYDIDTWELTFKIGYTEKTYTFHAGYSNVSELNKDVNKKLLEFINNNIETIRERLNSETSLKIQHIGIEQKVIGCYRDDTMYQEIQIKPKTAYVHNYQYDVLDKKDSVIYWIANGDIDKLKEVKYLGVKTEEIDLEKHMDRTAFLFTIPQHEGVDFIGWKQKNYSLGYWGSVSYSSGKGIIDKDRIGTSDKIVYSLYEAYNGKIKIECRDVDKEIAGKNSLIYEEERIASNGEHTVEAPEYQTDTIKYAALKGYVLDSSRVSSPVIVEIEKNENEKLVTFWYIQGSGGEVGNDIRAIITTYPSSTYVNNPIKIVNNSFGPYTGYQWYVNGGKITWPEDGTSLTKTVSTTLTIKLEIWDDEGNTSTDTKTIEWFDTDLDAVIGANPMSCIEGDTVSISNHSTGEYDNWEWKINDDVKTWGKDGGTIIAEAGNTTASLKIWNSKNGKSDTDTVTIGAIKPNIPPVAVIQAPHYVIRGTTINVKDYSSDSDGTIVNRQWSVTGASNFTSDLRTDGSGGTITVDEFTTITVHLTVTDNRGASDSTSQQIIIGGNEEIDIQIVESGNKKENRKISLDLSNSTVGAYYSIDWPNTKYTFTPISGLSKSDIKYETSQKGIDILSKEEGLFDLRVDMKDTGGRVKSKILKVYVTPDIPPIVNNSVDKTITFRPEAIQFDSEMYSSDDDILQISWNKMYYDSDDDGNYEEETPIEVSEGSLNFSEVGMYKIVGFAKEEFGQPTIEKFVTDEDRLETRVEIIVKVDNMSPIAEIETDIPPQMEKVDVLFILDEDVDTGDEYKVHDLDTGTIEPTPVRDYLKGSVSGIINKFKAQLVEAKVFIKDLKTDKYIKTVTATRTGDYATSNDNNFSNTYSYSKNNFIGQLDKVGVAWSERRVNLTESFIKYDYKNSSTKNTSIFSSQFYVNESRNISSNSGRKFITSAVFKGNIPRRSVTWSANYNYDTKYVTETEYKSNLSSKDDNQFSPTKQFSSGGYMGPINRQSVSYTNNYTQVSSYQTGSKTKFNLDSKDSSAFPSSMSAQNIASINGKWCTAVGSTNIPLININWTPISVGGERQTIYETVKEIFDYVEDDPDFPDTITKNIAGLNVTLYKDGEPEKTGRKGGGPRIDDKWREWEQEYKGSYTTPSVTKYDAKAYYGGNVLYQYVSSYNGTATYGGDVTKATFRDWTGRAMYSGNLTTFNLLDGFSGICDYLGLAEKLEKENKEPNWELNSNKYVVYVGDKGINNKNTLDDYKSDADADVVSISNKSLSSAVLNVNYTDIEENVDEVIAHIAGENPPIAKSAVLINEETFDIITKDSDPENDDIVLREIKYFHDPDYYLNSLGVTSLSQTWQDAEGIDMNNLTLDKPGQYIISYRNQDQPKDDSRFDEYKKFSNEAQVSIFGHRRPIVTDFDINFLYNPDNGKYEEPDFIVESYDPDYFKPSTGEGRTDKGIIAHKFRWKSKGESDSEYKFGLPTSLDAGIYNIEVMARDIDYAWSLPYIIEIDLTKTTLELDAEIYPEKDKFEVEIVGIPASEDLKVINIETIHAYPVDSVEFALYDDITEVVPKVILNNPADVKDTYKSRITWENIRNYTILSSLSDGMYKGKIEAKAGAIREAIEWDVKVHTPINLVPYINDRQDGEDIVVVSDDTFTVKAEVSEYTKEVTVELPFDCMNSSETITYDAGDTIKLNGSLGDTVFSKSFYLPPTSVPIEIENQQAIFKAYAVNHSSVNPNMEIAFVDFKTIGVKLEDLRISKIADYNWKNYFIDSNSNPTALAENGIKVKDMPVYVNDYEESIKLGYKVYFKIDSVGLSEDNDEIEIEASYYALDEDNTLYKADIYVEDDNSGKYKKLKNSLYREISKYLTLNKDHKFSHEKFPSKSTYNTWKFNIFLPYSTKVVKEGESLDLINDNSKKYRLLVVFDIVGKKSSGAQYDYSLKETLWSTDDGSVYGRNRATNLDLLGKGENHGEILYFDLKNTLQDDLKLYREW
ncbi:Athe_2463 domain-containing protein [Wukongibacter sp. M2B1]|uniref:Athe_2463 domain-containing protein n=1 Tax=Wukongibacter sp. M2B1 TaxID=3088895 RepID=UPI003D7B00EF